MNQLVDGIGGAIEVKSLAYWEEKRASALAAMQEVMGPLPGEEKRCALDVEVEEEVDCGSYVRQLLSYAAEPGGRVPAYLLIPKGAGPFPAALCLHPTSDAEGHKIVVGLSEKPNRSYASELAERGFVALAPSYPLLANYQPDWAGLGYRSATMKAIWDNMRGLDLLREIACVAPACLASSITFPKSSKSIFLSALMETTVFFFSFIFSLRCAGKTSRVRAFPSNSREPFLSIVMVRYCLLLFSAVFALGRSTFLVCLLVVEVSMKKISNRNTTLIMGIRSSLKGVFSLYKNLIIIL